MARLQPIGISDLARLPHTCPDCGRIAPPEAEWATTTVRRWGQCGWRISDQDQLIRDGQRGNGRPTPNTAAADTPHRQAAVLVAPPDATPNAGPVATTPMSRDAAVLVSLRIDPELRGGGLGRQLVRAAAALAQRHGCRGLEAIGCWGEGRCCQLSVDWLTSVGFAVTRVHPLTPRLRIDLSATVWWRMDLDAAWRRITALVRPEPPPEPIGRAAHYHLLESSRRP